MSKNTEIYSGLRDINGKLIEIGDTIRFLRCLEGEKDYTGIWEGVVTFEDGVFTIDQFNGVKQIENPIGWEQEHDYIDSRGWCVKVGYGEYGSWNVPRKPITSIHTGFGWTSEHFEKHYRPLCEKYGWGDRYINVEVVNG